MKLWLAVIGAGIIAAALMYAAVDKAVDTCERMQQRIQVDLGDNIGCDRDADCAAESGLTCPWTPCNTDNVPVRAARQDAVERLLSRFSLCTRLPHFRQLTASCESMKPQVVCIGKIYHNASCLEHKCSVW